jgi:multidrug efflux system membrane fusion protein
MSKNIVSASLVLLALALWMTSGYLRTGHAEESQTQRLPIKAASEDTRVRVSIIDSEPRTRQVVLRGRTESKRMVDVKAELAGAIVARPVERGMHVEKGDLLCEIAVDDREVALQEARAAWQSARIDHQGSLKLKKKGLLSDVAIANSEARQETAEANLHRQQLNLARTRIVAPFSGVVENLHLNIGDYATPGESCATLIDLNPMLVVARVTEAEVENLFPAQTVSGITATGRQLAGTVSFVGRQSDPKTRTYPIEITVDNEDYSIRSGLTVTLRIGVEKVSAHQISPSLLTLNDAGEIGLRIVDNLNRVQFKPIVIVEDSARGMWVTGLPSRVRLITVGQEYVAVGDIIEPVYSTGGADQFAAL